MSNPTDFHAYPIENFTFDILHGLQEQINADLYVSPSGNNTNTGLTINDPLQTIQYACSIILADELNPSTIYLSVGTYSPSTNSEFFPVDIPDYVSLCGVSETGVILNAEGMTVVIELNNVVNVTISNLTITNGQSENGGGIYCSSSSPSLENVTITDNSAYGIYSSGGGIYCSNSSPSLENVTITNNSAEDYGGGIYCYSSSPSLMNVTITDNSALTGGGIFCRYSSSPSLENVTITNNLALYRGGGIYCYSSSPSLVNVTITNNLSWEYGGGIYCSYSSSPSLENVTITGNSANVSGGGIYCNDTGIVFSSENRCSIYLNNTSNRANGNDIYSNTNINVIVDTFTVSNPTDFHAYPIENFTFDILHGLQEQVNADLYVSPEGDNDNSGLTIDEPLQTIQYACSVILADSLNLHTIHLTEGTFSPSINGEFFPVEIPDYVSLTGIDEDTVILDAEGVAGVIRLYCAENVAISDLTITNGYASYGGGIYCDSSSPILENVTITGNSAEEDGGGIYCQDNSNPILVNCLFWNNSPQEVKFSSIGDPNTITIAYSDIDGGEEGIITNNNGTVNWLEGNIDANPIFVDAEMEDYNLTEYSPCIDIGTNYFEYEGEILINLSEDEYYGIAPDMGAYESPFNSDEIEPLTDLVKVYPNPFNPETNILFELLDDSNVLLEIYNIKGQKVTTLVNEPYLAGSHEVTWNASGQSSGIYLLRFITAENSEMKKLMLLK